VKTQVSRFTESQPCTRCGAEPRRPGQRWGNTCFAEDARHRRAVAAIERKAGRTVAMRLTPEEADLIRESRIEPAGRHRAA